MTGVLDLKNMAVMHLFQYTDRASQCLEQRMIVVGNGT